MSSGESAVRGHRDTSDHQALWSSGGGHRGNAKRNSRRASKTSCGTPACKSRIALPNSARQARTDGKGLETDSILAFAELVPSEVAEAVVGGVFVGFAERGVIENLLDEFVDGETAVEGHHADVDEFGGVFADDTGAQEFFIGSGEDELEHARGISGDVTSGVVCVKRAAHDVVDFLFFAGFFGLTGSGYFRNRVNTHGEQRGNTLLVLQTKSVADGNAALLHGSRGQRGETDDVAGGVDMRNRRAIVFVDRDIAAIIDGQAGFLESQTIDGGAAAGGEQGGIGLERFAAFHGQTHAAGRVFGFDRAFVKQEMHTKGGEPVAKTIGNLIVEKWEKAVAPVHERDIHTKGFEDRSVFAADDAAADDSQAFRNAVHLKEGVGVKSVNVVEGDFRRTMGLGAGANEDDCSP